MIRPHRTLTPVELSVYRLAVLPHMLQEQEQYRRLKRPREYERITADIAEIQESMALARKGLAA